MTTTDGIRVPEDCVEFEYPDGELDGAGHARMTTADQVALGIGLQVVGGFSFGLYKGIKWYRNRNNAQAGGAVEIGDHENMEYANLSVAGRLQQQHGVNDDMAGAIRNEMEFRRENPGLFQNNNNNVNQ